MKITYNQLIRCKACEKQLKRFKRAFGNEVKITKAICKKYYKVFDYEWVVIVMFPMRLCKKYWRGRNLILDKYDQARKPIDDKYQQDKVMLFYKLSLTLD